MEKNISFLCELGVGETLEHEVTQPLYITRIRSNALEMAGCFYTSVGDDWFDLFVMKDLVYRDFVYKFEPGEKFQVHYTGYIPKYWVGGSQFRLILTLELLEGPGRVISR